MPQVTVYVNKDYIIKWKAVKNKSKLVYAALDAATAVTVPETAEMPNDTLLVLGPYDQGHNNQGHKAKKK
jgi:hypothetical protein